MRQTWTATAAVSVAACAALLLGGCSMSSASDEAGGVTQVEPAPALGDGGPSDTDFGDTDFSDTGFSDGGSADGGAVDGDTATESDPARAVIAQGSLFVTVGDPLGAADDAARIVEDAGGRIDRRSEQPAADGGAGSSAKITVRIPSARLTATVDQLKALGELEDYQLSEDDVTAQTRDLDARISALRASTGRLETLLTTATTTKDLIDIETTLSQRQSELESLESQARSLGDQVDLATLAVSFGPEETAPVDRPGDFFSGVATGWEGLVAFSSAVLVGIGVMLPWLIVPAIAALVVLAIVRSRRRRADAHPVAVTMEE